MINVGANPPGGLERRVTSTGRKYLLWNDLSLNPSLRNSDGIRPGGLLMLFQPLGKSLDETAEVSWWKERGWKRNLPSLRLGKRVHHAGATGLRSVSHPSLKPKSAPARRSELPEPPADSEN